LARPRVSTERPGHYAANALLVGTIRPPFAFDINQSGAISEEERCRSSLSSSRARHSWPPRSQSRPARRKRAGTVITGTMDGDGVRARDLLSAWVSGPPGHGAALITPMRRAPTMVRAAAGCGCSPITAGGAPGAAGRARLVPAAHVDEMAGDGCGC